MSVADALCIAKLFLTGALLLRGAVGFVDDVLAARRGSSR